jgi:hypothetical protein
VSGALAVRPDYGGPDPLRLAACERLHTRWTAHQTTRPAA